MRGWRGAGCAAAAAAVLVGVGSAAPAAASGASGVAGAAGAAAVAGATGVEKRAAAPAPPVAEVAAPATPVVGAQTRLDADADTGRADAKPGTGVSAPGVRYGWPLSPPPGVSRRFEAPPFRYGQGHRGADLLGAPGQTVLAAREGEVVFVGRVGGRGVVSVAHSDGLRTTYEPVTGTVAVGLQVARGDPIGTLEAGHPGCPAAACLHWGVRRGARDTAEYLDPLVLLRPRFVRLYPLPEP